MKIGIIRNETQSSVEYCESLINFLEGENHSTMLLQPAFHDDITCRKMFFSDDMKLIIILGGDGTILNTIRKVKELQTCNIPVLGINTGNVGFLTHLDSKDLGSIFDLKKILDNPFETEDKFLLEAYISEFSHEDEKGIEQYIAKGKDKIIALDEITISRSPMCHLHKIEVAIHDKHLDTYRGDGIIVSTPTGSTGYSKSANGPVIAPGCNVLSIVPINSYERNKVPIIIPDNSQILINLSSNYDIESEEGYYLIADLKEKVKIEFSQLIVIQKSNKYVKFIKNNFYDTLRKKLK